VNSLALYLAHRELRRRTNHEARIITPHGLEPSRARLPIRKVVLLTSQL
jgi:hypothetical protein